MKTEIKQPIDKMYFVYTLSHNGVIFYVGCTKNVRKRYMQHISKGNKQETGNKIRSIIDAGEMPELNIITYTLFVHARNIEETLIKCITAGGQHLYNTQCAGSCIINQNMPLNSRKQAIDCITIKQNKYIKKYNNHEGFYIVPTVGEKHYHADIYHLSQYNTVHHI